MDEIPKRPGSYPPVPWSLFLSDDDTRGYVVLSEVLKGIEPVWPHLGDDMLKKRIISDLPAACIFHTEARVGGARQTHRRDPRQTMRYYCASL